MSWTESATIATSVISAATAIAGAYFSWANWKKVQAKVGTITDPFKASEILPAWYTGRMMSDDWRFGLVTTDGSMILINRILRLSDDGKWIDVELADQEDIEHTPTIEGFRLVYAPTDRTTASVQISSVVTAVELMTS